MSIANAAVTIRAGALHIVDILTVHHRWDMMGCAGHPWLKTPQLDRLAASGIRFQNAFVTTSLCSLGRASMLTGQYAHGVTNNFQILRLSAWLAARSK